MIRNTFNPITKDRQYLFITDNYDHCFNYISNKRSYYISNYNESESDISSVYGNQLGHREFKNTFNFLFNTVKSGIYVKIYNNTLVCFEPFINSPMDNSIFRNEFTVNENMLKGGFSEFFTKLFNNNTVWATSCSRKKPFIIVSGFLIE